LFVMDEVITFRLSVGGAQSLWNATPDLTVFAKTIGGGFPAGAVGGREDVMAVFHHGSACASVSHSGTFNANPITMTAGCTAIEMFTPEQCSAINRLGED